MTIAARITCETLPGLLRDFRTASDKSCERPGNEAIARPFLDFSEEGLGTRLRFPHTSRQDNRFGYCLSLLFGRPVVSISLTYRLYYTSYTALLHVATVPMTYAD